MMSIHQLLLLLLACELTLSRPLETEDSPCLKLNLTDPKSSDVDLLQALSPAAISKMESSYTPLLVSGIDLQHLYENRGPHLEVSLCKATGHSNGGEDLLNEKVHFQLKEKGDPLNTSSSATSKGGGVFYIQDAVNSPVAVLLSEDSRRLLHESAVLQMSCPHLCFTLSLQVTSSKMRGQGGKVFRRHAPSDFQPLPMSLSMKQDHSKAESSSGAVVGVVVGVVMGVVGLLVLVLVLAMCGGKEDTFEPGAETAASKSRSEVAEQPQELSPVPQDTTPAVKELNPNGNPASSKTVPVAVVSVTSDEEDHRESSEQHSNSSLKDRSERGRTLSARSYDPLPEVPKLEPAEREGSRERDDNDEDDDDPYDEVPADNEDRMKDSDSEEEGEGEEGGADGAPQNNVAPKDSSSSIPPYGKVSRHTKPHEAKKQDQEEEDDSDSYAEVRDVVRRGPPFAQRDRSKTDPQNPPTPVNPREKRALTESAAHMPLPDIPPSKTGAASNMPPIADENENEMYDSIPESEFKKASPGSNSSPAGGRRKKKERVYESVDDMGEDEEVGSDKDLYESVPDTFTKLDSPGNLPPTPTLSPTKLSSPDIPPMPPRSPVPTSKEGNKEGLKKTLSAAQGEEKRRFSFFSRKKAGSVSTSSGLKRGDQPKSPTALTSTTSSTSPQHKPHPLPNIPIPPPPDDDEEDTYDKVTVTPNLLSAGSDMGDKTFQHGEDARSKSMSLPMAFRSGGGRPNLPLPRLPEDSGSAVVKHQRVVEGSEGGEYDTVHNAERIEDEPNYDTVKAEDILPPSTKSTAKVQSGFDPPYDKIDKQELEALREREALREDVQASSDEPADPSGGYSKVRGETPEGELDGKVPEHDEEGYAVVPEEIKMRKRALSASQGNRPLQRPRKDLSPDSLAAGYHVVGHDSSLDQEYDTIRESRSQSLSVSPKKSPGRTSPGGEDQYASVNMAAKHSRKKEELDEVLRMQEELRGCVEPREPSPLPPPLPPALLPEHLDEFGNQPPPIPAQSQGVHELVGAENAGKGGGELHPPDSTGDPPYAKVRSKTDNPYAEVNRPYAEVDILPQIPKAKSSSSAQPPPPPKILENRIDESLGFDVIGTVGVQESGGAKEKPYDTIEDVRMDMSNLPRAGEKSIPKLDTAEDSASGNIYDTLLAPDKDGKGDREGGEEHQEEEDEEEEVKYEEIDKTPRSMV